MPEKLMRWNGSEWVEVTSLVRNEVKIITGMLNKFISINKEQPTENVGLSSSIKKYNISPSKTISNYTKL